MELHQLRYFVEVVRARNFTRAAERCHVTQPTLSQQIRKLEDAVGEPLLQRHRKGAVATALGEQLYHRACTILAEVEAMEAAATAFGDGVQGRLRVGAIPTIAPYLLPEILQNSLRRYPALTFEISEEPTHVLLSGLRAGTLDVALLSAPLDAADMATQDLGGDEFLVAVPRNHPLLRAPAVDLESLRAYPMVLMQEAHCLRGQAVELCKQAGFHPEVIIQSSQLDTVLAMVESGLGISLIPAMSRHAFKHRKVVFRSFEPNALSRRIALAWPSRALPTRAFTAFTSLCAELRSEDKEG